MADIHMPWAAKRITGDAGRWGDPSLVLATTPENAAPNMLYESRTYTFLGLIIVDRTYTIINCLYALKIQSHDTPSVPERSDF